MDEISTETQEQVIGALGRAIVKRWSRLPRDFQQHLFEKAVRSEGESVRQQIAFFLHHKYPVRPIPSELAQCQSPLVSGDMRRTV